MGTSFHPEDCNRMSRKDPKVQGKEERDYYLDGFDVLPGKPNPPLAERGLHVHPRKGAALLWYSRRPDGQIDPASQHTGCRLKSGLKFTVVNWMHFEGGRGCSAAKEGCLMRDYKHCARTDNMTCQIYLDPFGHGRPRG